MRSRLLLPALVFCLGLAGLAVLPLPAAAPPANTKSVAQLIEQLSSNDYDAREAAFDTLELVGEPALAGLRKAAADSTDAEVKKRAAELIVKIERRAETNRILASRRVTLSYKNTPVAEAVADLRKQTGYNIVLHDPAGRLRDRKVTLETGNVPFWQGLDLFCAKAGLIEGDPNSMPVAPPPPPLPPGGRKGGIGPIGPPPLPPAVPPRGGIRPLPAIKKAELPAKRAALAADAPAVAVKAADKEAAVRVAVAMRVAVAKPVAVPVAVPLAPVAVPAIALPPGGGFGPGMPFPPGGGPGFPGRPGFVPALLTLQISPEPKLQWQRLIDVRIQKAIDEKGRSLREPMGLSGGSASIGGPPGMVPPGAFIGAKVRGGPYYPHPNSNLHHYAPVRLSKGDAPGKMLKELTGMVTADVLSESQPLLVATDILKAKGKTFTGKQGGKFKINSVDARPGGQVIIQFEFEMPPGAIADNFPVPQPVIQPVPPRRLGGARGGAVPAPAAKAALALKVMPGPGMGGPMVYYPMNYFGISLRDDKGNVLPASVNQVWNRGGIGLGGVNRDYQLVYNPQKDHGKVTSMVFSGRRNVTVSIPFTLKDVKLP
jgi:hypothetical protein